MGFFDILDELFVGCVDVVFVFGLLVVDVCIEVYLLWIELWVFVVLRLYCFVDCEMVLIDEVCDEVFVIVGGGVFEIVNWWLVDL